MPKNPDPDWHNDPDIVVPKQMPIRIFTNTRGNVVIVQESETEHEDDPLVEIRPEYVRAVIAALTRQIEAAPEAVD